MSARPAALVTISIARKIITRSPADNHRAGRVWDLPTRLFHWTLVVTIGGCWWTAENAHLDWHRWCGYAVLGLLTFRLYWGLAGASSARFASFVKGPRKTFAYVRSLFGDPAQDAVGHNPIGALSIVAMLFLLVVQTVLGLYAVDVDGVESGPLALYISFDQGRAAAEWHELTFNALLALIGLHLAAIVFYASVKRSNLVGPMLTGRKAGAASARFAPAWRIFPGLVFAAAIIVAVMKAFRF